MDQELSPSTMKGIKRRRLVTILTIVLIASVAYYLFQYLVTPSVSRNEIRTAKVTRGALTAGINAGGVLVPKYEETVTSEINSIVESVLVQAGQKVQAGQALLLLDTSKVKLELDRMDEQLALKQNAIDRARINLNKALNNNRSRMELLEVDLDIRRTRYERLERLSKSGIISLQDLKEAESNVKRTEIEIKQLNQANLDLNSDADSLISRIHLEKSILVKSQQETERLLNNATVRAPRGGVVDWLKSEEGSRVREGEALARIADTREFKLKASLSDFYANQISAGMQAEFQYAEENFQGELESIVAAGEQGVLTLMIRLISGDTSKLRHKQRVDVNIITHVIENSLLISKGPFATGSGLQKVFLISEEQALNTEITLGASNDHYFEITEGLQEGDEIIISDLRRLNHLKEININ